MATKGTVPLGKRIAAWLSSIVVGVAMYVVFGTVLTVAPARDELMIRGEIAAIPKRLPPVPAKVSPEEAREAVAQHRATAATLLALYHEKAGLEAECIRARFWAAMIGIVAGVGSFALCSVYWLRRGAEEAAASEESAPSGDAQESEGG